MTSPFKTLGLASVGATALVTLQRPQRANAINETMLIELDRAFDELLDDDSVRVVVLRGEGKGFSGGHDRQEPMIGLDSDASILSAHHQMGVLVSHLERVWRYPKPTIASVHGYCIGAASQLAACCDLTVVAEDAEIGLASVPTGAGFLAPSWALFAGIKRAKQLALDYGSRIDGRTAVSWGWANVAVPVAQLEEATLALAGRVARVPSDLLLGQKVAINRVAEINGFRAALAGGIEMDLLVRTSPEAERQRRVVRENGLRAAIEEFKKTTTGRET